VEAIDGEISVDSKIGEGSKFTIRMPLRHGTGKWKSVESIDNLQNIDEPMVQESDGGMPADVDSGDEDRIKLLIIDDNSDIAKYIGSQFEGKYDLFYAADGKVGLEKAREVLPDIIISDLMMPEMDGLTLCRMVRKDEFISHIPLILVTAKCSEEDRIKGFEAGVDAYIGKPFNNDELRVRVEKLLEQRKALMQKYSKATQEGTETEVQRTEADKSFLCNAMKVIYKLIDDHTFNVGALADELCMSQRQLNRKIIALTGETPAKYILLIKLRRAKQLIDSRADMSIEEISDRCGFEHYSSFYHGFKKTFGIAPSDYKRGVK
jgi:Response regulators consisting of a CheY-like receiver domain and a winged-helix DNA-binding domain